MGERSIGFDVTPSARRLTGSLRHIGYDFPAAVADLVDNSISAGASTVDVELVFDGERSYVLLADDGSGMVGVELTEALRFGTRREYDSGDLGRYGLGLKTASLSQCRRVTVVSRRSPVKCRVSALTLDLDHVVHTDRWEVIDPPEDTSAFRALDWLKHQTGTVVVWEHLDRVLPEKNPAGAWARRRLDSLAQRTAEHLGIVFHRFLEGTTVSGPQLVITVNGEKVTPWNPFAPDEASRLVLPVRSYDLIRGEEVGVVALTRYVLPPRSMFSTQAEFERLSGPAKWNRQQGLYIYRSDRLVQSGGWNGIRAIDEHTKLARASLDFAPQLDEAFQINVAKMRVVIPPEVRSLIEPHVTELCHRAEEMYRRDLRLGTTSSGPAGSGRNGASADLSGVGAAILASALAAGCAKAFDDIIDHLARERPELVSQLGWRD